LRRGAKVLALCGILLHPLPATTQWPQQDEGTFEGFWAMSGTMHILELPNREVVAGGGLTGTVTVQTSQGPVPSFETDCVVFADTRSKGVGRCIWTATTGDLVLVDLESDGPPGGERVRGVFSGGTGRFESLSGRFQFEWNYRVSGGKDATLDGATYEMTGRYRLERR
jgi:hypothetical protein